MKLIKTAWPSLEDSDPHAPLLSLRFSSSSKSAEAVSTSPEGLYDLMSMISTPPLHNLFDDDSLGGAADNDPNDGDADEGDVEADGGGTDRVSNGVDGVDDGGDGIAGSDGGVLIGANVVDGGNGGDGNGGDGDSSTGSGGGGNGDAAVNDSGRRGRGDAGARGRRLRRCRRRWGSGR